MKTLEAMAKVDEKEVPFKYRQAENTADCLKLFGGEAGLVKAANRVAKSDARNKCASTERGGGLGLNVVRDAYREALKTNPKAAKAALTALGVTLD